MAKNISILTRPYPHGVTTIYGLKEKVWQIYNGSFLLTYKRATGKPLPDNPDHFPPLKTGSMKHYLFPTEGVGADSHLLQLFEQAQKSIFIGTPYFIPPEK